MQGLLSKEYAKARYATIDWERNDPAVKPGDPYPFQGGTNPFAELLARWTVEPAHRDSAESGSRTAGHGRSRFDATVLRRHHLDRGGGRGGLGGVDHAERRLGSGGDRGADRRRAEPAGAELRHRRGGRAVQRDRAGQAPAGDAHADAGAQGRAAVPRVRGAGRRQPGSEPAAVLPQRGGVRDDAAAGGRGAEHQQLPDALARSARTSRGRACCWWRRPRRTACARRCGGWGTRWSSRSGPRGRSTRSCSTGSTARCGGRRAITGRITGSLGSWLRGVGEQRTSSTSDRS